jgi:hypothetical protein
VSAARISRTRSSSSTRSSSTVSRARPASVNASMSRIRSAIAPARPSGSADMSCERTRPRSLSPDARSISPNLAPYPVPRRAFRDTLSVAAELTRGEAARTIDVELAVHTDVEETVFYPWAHRRSDDIAEVVDQGIEERQAGPQQRAVPRHRDRAEHFRPIVDGPLRARRYRRPSLRASRSARARPVDRGSQGESRAAGLRELAHHDRTRDTTGDRGWPGLGVRRSRGGPAQRGGGCGRGRGRAGR